MTQWEEGPLGFEVFQFDDGQWHLSIDYDEDEVDEIYLPEDPIERERVVGELRTRFRGFSGSYEDACDLVACWADLDPEGE